jgi:S-disulfanyl-L-cysteine oxidoreductase SoxD
MPMHKILLFSVMCILAFGGSAASAQNLNLGKPINPTDFAAWDIDVEPDGAGLPPGSGTSDQGAPIFAECPNDDERCSRSTGCCQRHEAGRH